MASTFDELVSEGTLRAGAESISDRVGAQVKLWLRSQAKAFLWPQLKVEYPAIPLAAGVQVLTLGNGDGGVEFEIHRINDPIHIYNSTYTAKADVRIRTDWASSIANAISEKLDDPAKTRGLPDMAKVRMNRNRTSGIDRTDLVGRYDLVFNRVADQNYLLEVSMYLVPSDPSGSQVPWFPNDRTVEQAVYYNALKHLKDPSASDELELLAKMVGQDRLAEGMKPGISDGGIGMDPSTFR